MNKFRGEFKKVPIDQLSPNDWNPKESVEDNAFNKARFELVKQGIEQKSLYMPIIVRSIGPSTYQIIDGFHRWKACTELDYTEILIWDLGDVDLEEAQSITLDSIYRNIPPSEPLTAQIVKAISLTNPEALKLLPFSELQITEYKELAEFNFDAFKDNNPGASKEAGEDKIIECPECGAHIDLKTLKQDKTE